MFNQHLKISLWLHFTPGVTLASKNISADVSLVERNEWGREVSCFRDRKENAAFHAIDHMAAITIYSYIIIGILHWLNMPHKIGISRCSH